MKKPIGKLLWNKTEILVNKTKWFQHRNRGVISLLLPFKMINTCFDQEPTNRIDRIRTAIRLKFIQLFGKEPIKEQICIIKQSNFYGGHYKIGNIRGAFYIDNKEVYDNIYNYFVDCIKL